MLAAVLYGIKDLRVEKVEDPKIGKGDVLVKVKTAAICGTDTRIYNYGHSKLPAWEKRILGHELAGEVVQVGNKVKEIKVGERVAIAPNIGCGRCELCTQGFYLIYPILGGVPQAGQFPILYCHRLITRENRPYIISLLEGGQMVPTHFHF